MPMTDPELFSRLSGAGSHLVARFVGLTDAQRLAVPAILDRRPTLLVARTASGKTEAVLAPLLTLHGEERWSGRPSILYVAPTRALVNDLHARLATTLAGYLVVGRKTGEHRDRDVDLLVTTPESLDSMLVRGRDPRTGEHRLARVQAIVLDELHLLAEFARGTQLEILLGRLDAIAQTSVLRVGLSATVADAAALARRFLGANAAVCTSDGSRTIAIGGALGTLDVPTRGTGLDPLAAGLLRTARGDDGPLVRRLLELRRELGCLKALVFVPSRARCDALSAALRQQLRGRAPVSVHAHHGALERGVREAAEDSMAVLDEAVTVATSTLEVGIDIGDVNVVVLDGPPASVSSLLQRIGRGNRRSGSTFVLPVVHDDVEALTMASMLRAAISGELDPERGIAHYSVAFQQIASLLRGSTANLNRRALAEPLAVAWGAKRARFIVDELVLDGALGERSDGRLYPREELAELLDQPLRLHANIAGSGGVVPLVDAVTGETLAWVPAGQPRTRVAFGGSTYVPHDRGDVIELTRAATGGATSIRYASRRAPIGRDALRHFARGLGLADHALVQFDGAYWHFGGALFNALLRLAGGTSSPLRSAEDPRCMLDRDLPTLAARGWDDLERYCNFGPLQTMLPESVRREAVVATVEAHHFDSWLSAMRLEANPTIAQARVMKQA